MAQLAYSFISGHQQITWLHKLKIERRVDNYIKYYAKDNLRPFT